MQVVERARERCMCEGAHDPRTPRTLLGPWPGTPRPRSTAAPCLLMQVDSGTRRILLWSVLGLGLLATSEARAQEPTSALAPSVTLTVPWLLPGEPTGTIGFSPRPAAASRLSFQGGVPHQIGGGLASCVRLEEPAGSGVSFPLRRFTSARVSPALVLVGFSGARCPVRVHSDTWTDLTNELHGGIPLSKQGVTFGTAAW
jgi:hypothetical protein